MRWACLDLFLCFPLLLETSAMSQPRNKSFLNQVMLAWEGLIWFEILPRFRTFLLAHFNPGVHLSWFDFFFGLKDTSISLSNPECKLNFHVCTFKFNLLSFLRDLPLLKQILIITFFLFSRFWFSFYHHIFQLIFSLTWLSSRNFLILLGKSHKFSL